MKNKYIILAILIIFLTSCRQTRNDLDSGIFTDQPCRIPCWQNLTPGQSSLQDINQFLGKLSKQNWPERFDSVISIDCRIIHVAEKETIFSDSSFYLQIENNLLTFIGSYPASQPHIDEIIDRFGSPEYIEPVLAIGPERDTYFLAIHYPQLGISFDISTEGYQIGEINQDMRIRRIDYYSPGDLLSYFIFKDYCDIGSQAKSQVENYIERFIRPWTDFGTVEVIPSH